MIERSTRDEDMFEMLSSIDQAWKKYARLSGPEVAQGLKASLKDFSQLKNLRIIVQDEPSYLEGRLTQEQRQYIDTNFRPDALFWESHNVWFRPEVFFYRSQGLDAAHSLLQAFSEIGGHVQDLRFSMLLDDPEEICSDKLLYLLPKTLCSLRMSINWVDFEVMEDDHFEDYSGEFFKALGKLDNLQDVALYLIDHDYNAESIDQLFQALQKTSKLRCLVLKGKWMLSPTSLVKFLDKDAPSLRSLTLEGCLLDGDCLTTLHSLAAVTRDRLEYLRMWHLQEPTGPGFGAHFEAVAMKVFLQSEWPEFTFTTDFGPRFELMPDSGEEENNIPEGGEPSPEVDGDGDHQVEAVGEEGDTGLE